MGMSLIPISLERRERPINSNQGQPTLANGKEDSEMGLEFKSGQMVLAMRESGRTTGLMERGNSHMLTRMNMRENGQMIRQMVEVSTDIRMVLLMMAFGKKIYSMERELKNGLTEVCIKASI